MKRNLFWITKNGNIVVICAMKRALSCRAENYSYYVVPVWHNFSERNLFAITKAENIVVIRAMKRAYLQSWKL